MLTRGRRAPSAQLQIAPGNLSVIFADEAQDLNRMQLTLIRKWGRHCNYFIVSGNEDQTKLRDRSRSMKLRVVEIARVSRSTSEQGQQRMKDLYGKVLETSGRVARQAQQFADEIASGVKRSADRKLQAALESLKTDLETMLDRVKQVRRQARARVFGGNKHVKANWSACSNPPPRSSAVGKPSNRPSSAR